MNLDGATHLSSLRPPPGYGILRKETPSTQGDTMTNRTYRLSEIVGTSPEGVDEAIRNGVRRAAKTIRHIDWFEVQEIRGHVRDGEVDHFQVAMKIGFRLEDV